MTLTARTALDLEIAQENLAFDIQEFNKFINRFVDVVVPEMFNEFVRFIAIEAYSRIIDRTPVDTGRARGNWTLNIGRPVEFSGPGTRRQVESMIRQAERTLERLEFGKSVWIANGVEYIIWLEQGSSRKAAEGMVSVTLEELKQIKPIDADKRFA